MRHAAAVAALAALAISCNRPRPAVVHPVDPARVAALVEIARAEARRADGVDDLARRADDADPVVRAAALRGLGRVGVTAPLVARLDGDDAAAAAAALGYAGALESIDAGEVPAVTAALAALAGRGGAGRAEAIAALGRAGDAGGLAAITAALGADDPAVAAAAGVALGMLGRRGVATDAAAIAAAVARADDADAAVRRAAVFGLGRGFVATADGTAPAGADDAVRALVARVADADPEVRALALAGLARRKARAAAGDLAPGALADDDWRVQVEAIRLVGGGAAGPTADDARALAALVTREWARLGAGGAPASTAHVVMEALGALAPATGVVEVRVALDAIATSLRDRLPVDRPADLRLAADHVRALVHAALARADGGTFTLDQSLAIVEGVQLPAEVTGALVADALVARLPAHPEDAARLVARAGADQPAGRRAATLEALGGVYGQLGDRADAAIDAVVAGLGDAHAEVAGSAADAAAAIVPALRAQDTLAIAHRGPELVRALLARIDAAAGDPELLASLLGAAGTGLGADARAACEAARAHANPVVRAAARTCLAAITGADPGAGPATPAAIPPVDPATVVGHRVTWRVETTRGAVTIALDADAAPWHVAAIAQLTRTGFYDGLLFHRVVPDFVVQGGDPDGTGWGGPGFTLPSEPSALPYERGAIGIADSGKDTGGSQWFVVHTRTPHLEGRYTVVGHVVDGDAVIDQLLVGDRITTATVTIE